MNSGKIIMWAFVAFIAIALMNGCSSYNSMVKKNEGVTSQWQQVENVYQRRMDLIPNLVSTVQGYADFEKSTLEAVINARANATKITIDASKLDAEQLQKFEQAQGSLTSALSKLMVVSEQYPDLKANQGFGDLRVELSNSENKIANERKKFNDVVQEYNTFIQLFPRNIWSGIFHFEKREYFKMQEGADKAPDVKFDFNKK
jgi:LemA protein